MVHEVQVVHILQTQPVGLQCLVLTEVYTLGDGIEFVQRLLLQIISVVDAQVFRLTAPGQRIRTGQYIFCRQFLGSLSRSHKAHLTLQHEVRQRFEEVEDTRSGILTHTKGLGTYPDVDDILTLRQSLQHVCVFLRIDREISPTRIREVETQLIAQVRVTQQHFHLRCTGALINLVRGLPTDDMLGTFGEDGFVTQLIQVVRKLIGIEQLCVPYALCLHSQDHLQQFTLELKLFLELLLIILRSQRISVRGSKELNGLGGSQLLEDIDHLRVELLEHLQHRTADAQGAVELTFGEVDHVFDSLAKRQIRGLYQPVNVLFGGHIIIVIMVMTDLKETIALQTIRCVHLEA